MSNLIKKDQEYKVWFSELKQHIRQSQIKAAVAVNTELIRLYWQMGKEITEKQAASKWGSGFYAELSRDLRAEFSDMRGFSDTNIRYMKRMYDFYNQQDINLPQVVEEIVCIPWGHHRILLDKCKSVDEALFYVEKTIINGWSRNVLLNFLDTNLFHAQGRAITNFTACLPAVQSDLAQQTLKDPYVFDFLTMTEGYRERELEDALTENITKFLLELGNGFAYVGRQVRLEIGKEELFADLLFYNYKLRCFIVVELKTGKFKPEYVSKLGVYVAAVNDQLRDETDKPTIGLLICKTKDEVMARYALGTSTEPIGISEYELSKVYPKDLQSSLPSIEDIENELKGLNE